MSDEEWIERLEQIGAGASREELWQHLAQANWPWVEDATELLMVLIASEPGARWRYA